MLQDFLHSSSENMRLLEEQSRLEKRIEESERKGEEIELRLEDELCSVRSRLAKEEVATLV